MSTHWLGVLPSTLDNSNYICALLELHAKRIITTVTYLQQRLTRDRNLIKCNLNIYRCPELETAMARRDNNTRKRWHNITTKGLNRLSCNM